MDSLGYRGGIKVHMLNLSNIGFIHVVWETNSKRIELDPPFRCLPGNVNTGNPDIDAMQKETEDRNAKRYDYYRDIKSISLLLRTNINQDNEIIHFRLDQLDSEYTLIKNFWDFISRSYISHLAGWNITHSSFPLLVGKAMQYGVKVPPHFMPNPFKRFQDPAICELSTLYTQCGYQKARPLPDLNDLGSWWGLPTSDALPPVSSLRLSEMSAEDMEKYGYRAIAKSLDMMINMLILYGSLVEA